MSHQDRTSDIIVNHQTIKQVVDWLLAPKIFTGISARSAASWKPRMLAAAAIFWATAGGNNLTDRFDLGRKVVGRIFRWQNRPGETYQGFIKMLRKWHCQLLPLICSHVRVQMKEVLPDLWKIAGYVVFAGDGSRIKLARTKSLEDDFSPQRKKKRRKPKKAGRAKVKRKMVRPKTAKKQSAQSMAKKANSPQMWLTMLWNVGTGLPWDWKTGPSDSSERGHLKEMLAELPENSLITADAGFVGYDFWKTLLDAGHNFLIRVGPNVSLLKQLGYARQYEYTVYLWPARVAKKKQEPLVLRLIVINNGKQPVFLVTNLSQSQLSDRQSRDIYGARWGIEIFFRTFKQTFGCRKLRSRSAANAKLELDWSLLGLWCLCLLGQRELVESGEDPTWLSAAATIKAFQGTLADYRVRPETRKESLWSKLRVAVLDSYERTGPKASRSYPQKKKYRRIGSPKIVPATQQKIKEAKQLKQKTTPFRFTA